MAVLKKGITGNLRGKLGGVCGQNWKGIGFLKSLPEQGNNKVSLKKGGNGTKLLQIAKLWQNTKSGLSELLKVDFPELSINYNSCVKDVISYYNFDSSSLLTPMSFGNSQFFSTVRVSGGSPSGSNTVRIKFDGCNSLYVNNPNANLRYRFLNSSGYLSILYSATPKSNEFTIAISGMPPNPNSWICLLAFFYSIPDNKKSAAYMASAIRSS